MRFIPIISLLAILMYFPVSAQSACSGATCCTVSSGVTTAPSNDSCETEPVSYGITLYEKYLCTSAPTTPLSVVDSGGPRAYDLSVGTTCFKTFDSSDGSTVDMSSTSTNLNFDGTFTRPPNGVYTHGVMLIKNEFRIKQDFEFSSESITGDAGGEGKYCVTTSNTGAEADGNSMTCSATDGATPGIFTSIMSTFSGSCGSFDATADFTFTSGDKIEAWLLNTSNQTAFNCTEVVAKDRLFGLQTFSIPVVVTELTSGFDMAFGASSGSSLWQNGPGGTYSTGSGPFKVIITPINY
tara:strand:+ start:2893 stop:3780 length:888 start_codon:yes stop_codon:yes gene_type:complete